MLKLRLEREINNGSTLLGAGAVSKNCVDSIIELSNDYELPIMLIASRNQIDFKNIGGGYVNNWSTEDFAQYVINKDKKGKVVLARDHGGPWQHQEEIKQKLSLKKAMESAKHSYAKDIDCGFDILHIDPSVDINGQPDIEEILFRVYELYDFCYSYALKKERQIAFEIGTEEQSGKNSGVEELEFLLKSLKIFTNKNKMPMPLFVVAQTGTKVIERRNIGTFDSCIPVSYELPPEIQVPKILEVCKKYGVFLKVHNGDYLSDESLQWHPRLKIDAINVAPEFGVSETLSLVKVLKDNNLKIELENFLEISYSSKKWQKWISKENNVSDFDKSILSGHYVFATKEFISLKKIISDKLQIKGLILDEILREDIKSSIKRYLLLLGLLRFKR